MDNKYRCTQILPLFRSEATSNLEGLEFYLDTLESFIDNERNKEITKLKRQVEHLSDDDQGDFWAWHYPVHWEEIFASQLRASFIVTVMSLVESHLGMVAELAHKIESTTIKSSDLRGTLFERHRKFLELLGEFNRPSKDSWKSLHEIREIRNSIVHGNSTIYHSQNQERLRALVKTLPGLSSTHDVIELSSEFPKHSLAVVKNFITELYEEASSLCHRFVL